MSKKNNDISDINYTSPEEAYNAGERYYKVTLIENNKEYTQIRPIFIINKGERTEISAAYLYKFFQMSEKCIILQNGALDTKIRYIWKDGVYQTANDNDVMRHLMQYIEDYNICYLNSHTLRQALELSDCTCERYPHDIMNNNEDYINFKNGLLNIRTLELEEHTPEVMSSIQIPANWSDTEIPTPHFDDYLDTLTSGDDTTKTLILEYIGAIISNVQGWRFKKALFLLGKGDTGKSTLINLVSKLLGHQNIAERDLKSLNGRFGKTAAYNRRLIYSNDLSFMKIEENSVFKNLTGGDAISIEYKNKEPFDFKFKGFLLYGMNDLPHFDGDKGDHVYNRIIIVKCNNVIQKFDPQLSGKLYRERDGIIHKCVIALRKAIDNNYQFSIPEQCICNMKEYKRENSYPIEFWNTYVRNLTYNETPNLRSQQLYDNYRKWCTEEGIRILSAPEFRKEIANCCGIPWSDMTKRYKQGMLMTTHTMNDEWKLEYGYQNSDPIVQ